MVNPSNKVIPPQKNKNEFQSRCAVPIMWKSYGECISHLVRWNVKFCCYRYWPEKSTKLFSDLQLVINFEFLIGAQNLIALKLFQGGVFVFCLCFLIKKKCQNLASRLHKMNHTNRKNFRKGAKGDISAFCTANPSREIKLLDCEIL